jgi:hypothetical protein
VIYLLAIHLIDEMPLLIDKNTEFSSFYGMWLVRAIRCKHGYYERQTCSIENIFIHLLNLIKSYFQNEENHYS